ncbi:MAG: peptidylprolyl isomerase [Gemmatimonadota bacterium]
MNAQRLLFLPPALFLALGFLALGACDDPRSAGSGEIVARAAGVEFSAEAAAEILAPQTQLPNRPGVVNALANLWVDYFLLARVVAEDTTLAHLDVSPLVRQTTEQEMVLQLREQAIQADTIFTDEELREIFERDLPGAEIRARHILLRLPTGASQAQEDSVRALAESLRERILAGESFPLLAGQFSQDQGSAIDGGDLGTFSRGQMAPQFEEAAFNLSVGEVSEVVETPFGLHLIKLEERIVPPFEENLDEFRTQMRNRRVAVAESIYVANVLDRAEIEILEGEFESARQIAHAPDTPLTRRAEDRTLIRFNDGEITLADFREWVRFRPPVIREEIRRADDQLLEAIMQDIAREHLLVKQAGLEGIEVAESRSDSLARAIRGGVRTLARQTGFLSLGEEAEEGADLDQVANRAVLDFLRRVVGDRETVIPMGGVSSALRVQFGARIYEAGIQGAVERIAQKRAQPSSSLSDPPVGAVPDSAGAESPDSGSRGSGREGDGGRNP